jgi:hypothetical protein
MPLLREGSWWVCWRGSLDGMQGGLWTYPHRRPGRPPLAEEVQRLIVRPAKRTPAGATAHRGRAPTAWHARLGNRDPHDAAPPFARPAPRRTTTTWRRSCASKPRASWRATSLPSTRCGCDGCTCGSSSSWTSGGSTWPGSPPTRRHLGRPAGPQPCGGAGRAGPAATVPAPRREVHPRVRRGGRLGGRPGAPRAGAGAQRERLRGTLDPDGPRRVLGLAAHHRARPPGPGRSGLCRALQRPPSTPGTQVGATGPTGRSDRRHMGSAPGAPP